MQLFCSQIPKLLVHRMFPNARFSLWIDGKLELVVDPYQILERYHIVIYVFIFLSINTGILHLNIYAEFSLPYVFHRYSTSIHIFKG